MNITYTVTMKIDANKKLDRSYQAVLRVKVEDDSSENTLVLYGYGINMDDARMDLLDEYRRWITAHTENRMQIIKEICS